MLGGKDPVIIIQLSVLPKSVGQFISKIPLVSQIPTVIDQPPIPVYLSETLFNIAIIGSGKQIDIETITQGKTDGSTPDTNQNPIQSSVEIDIEAKQDSVAITLLSALLDQVYEKATSKEYSISFLYGATTIFRAMLISYQVSIVEGTDKLSIKIKLSKGEKNPVKTNPVGAVPGSTGTIPVGAGA